MASPKVERARKKKKAAVAKRKKTVAKAKKNAATDAKLGIREGRVKKGSVDEFGLRMRILSEKLPDRERPKPRKKTKLVGA